MFKKIALWAVYGTANQKQIDAGRFRLSQMHAAHEADNKRIAKLRQTADEQGIIFLAKPVGWEQKSGGLTPKQRAHDEVFGTVRYHKNGLRHY